MYDDDLYSIYNAFNTTTTTDEDEEQQSVSSYNPSSYGSTTTSYNPYSTDTGYQDDYSVTPNYEEQSSYNSVRQAEEVEAPRSQVVSQMNTPMIKREAPAVVLTKTKQKIYLQARMKIVLAMFVTIVCSLLFVSIFNFVNVGKINSSIADKQATINELQANISELQATYNMLSDDGYVEELATNSGFVDSSESATTLNYGEVYTEPVIEDLPSNWFNDVCDFLSGLFAA